VGRKIAVLLSGGVDSSTVAYMVKNRYPNAEVVGVTLLLYRNEEDIENAKRVCEFLKIPHRVLDLRKPFEERIIKYFLEEYKRGRTPNPCAVCNQEIKLGLATEILTSEGFEKIFTGHYVRKVNYRGFLTLERPKDTNKDQTYFLALLKRDYLKYLEFPLGDYTKEEVRQIAKRAGLPTQSRKESQDICFLEGQKLKDFLKKHIPPSAGVFVYKGKVVGKHSGYYAYTIGQRRGLGIRLGKPVYVVDIDAETNTVVVGDKEDLLKDTIEVENLNLFLPLEEVKYKTLYGQIRYRTPAKEVERIEETDRGLKIKFKEPFSGVARGQIAALYLDNKILVAGGVIA
jgi:tRNA-specific 2-thiouridylase